MLRTRTFRTASLVGALLVLAGCSSADGPAVKQTDWPHGRNDLVLRMETLPGMAPPHAGQVPDFSMYGDGTVVLPASRDPGRAVTHLDRDIVGDLLAGTVALVDSGEATGVAGPDAPVVELIFIRDGARDQVSLDGTDAGVTKLRERVLDAVADAQP